jgi:hypothetical protein
MKKNSVLLHTVTGAPVFRPDGEVAEEVRGHINRLADLIQEAKDRGIVVTFNIGDRPNGRSGVTQLEIVKRIPL